MVLMRKPGLVIFVDDMLDVTQFTMQIFADKTIVCVVRIQLQLLVLGVNQPLYFLSSTATATTYFTICAPVLWSQSYGLKMH